MPDKISCPNCSHEFDVEEALAGKIEAHFKKEFEQKLAEQSKRFSNERAELEKEREAFKQAKERENELFVEKLNQKLEQEKKKVEAAAQESVAAKMKALQEENEKRKNENRILQEKEVTLLKKEQALIEQQEQLALKTEKEMLQRQQEIEEKARKKERENFELEKVKLLKQIEDNKKLAEEMKRKAEQGSMQMQGEVQELAIEQMLAQQFPFDQIEEVPKGVRGADIIQNVVNASQQVCGKIVFESKRTKAFAGDWIDKLKQDQITCKADIAVLVTETMPKEMDRFGQKDGVWVCSYQEVQSLTAVLREVLVKTHAAAASQENKGEKMELLYAYLTGNEFIQNIKRIVENYDAMIHQLNSEKKAMHKIWAQREKQIWVVQENISSLFGSIKGIAGNSLPSSEVLELPDADIEE